MLRVIPRSPRMGIVTGARADFVYAVTRDFVRNCQTPILVLPDDVPGTSTSSRWSACIWHPTRRSASTRGRDTPDKIPLAVRHIRTFLRANRLGTAAHQPMAAAVQ
jgi:hypothetical protein